MTPTDTTTETVTSEVPVADTDTTIESAGGVHTKLVPLFRITADPALQVRGRIDPAKVEEYRALIKEHTYMDPMDLFYQDPLGPDTVFAIADGFHRLAAYTAEEYAKVPARLRLGTRSDALQFGLKKNGHHGAAMTNTEKRHAASIAVADPVVGEMTDLAIAKLIGCSSSLVGDARRGETAAQKTEKRTARDEKKYAPGPAASKGKQETESPAPPAAKARERKPTDPRPTMAQILKQIETYINTDVVDEVDVIGLMQSKECEYRFMPKSGMPVQLRVVGKSGRVQVECEVIVKTLGMDGVVLRLEQGKLTLEE